MNHPVCRSVFVIRNRYIREFIQLETKPVRKFSMSNVSITACNQELRSEIHINPCGK